MAFRTESVEKKSRYYSIKEGTFRLPTDKEDPEAVARPYNNPKTGVSGVAYERAYKALFGKVKDVSFRENTLKDGTNLRSMNIYLGDDENGIGQVISIPVSSRFTADFLKKLPNIDLDAEVRIAPYDFEPEQGPRRVGLTITQPDSNDSFNVKVENFFLQETLEADGHKTYKNLHGFPEATDEDKKDWPFYFKKCEKFLIKYAEENILHKFGTGGGTDPDATDETEDAPTDEVSPDDIPL